MTILIIGAGQAALTTAEKYRALGGEDEVIILGDEAVLPYQRPPLSKAYLAGEMTRERLLLRPPEWYETNAISVRSGCTVETIDRNAMTVRLHDGETLSYDRLVLATGARARPLPGVEGEPAGLYTLRGLADIDAMRDEFSPGRRLLVIGGGYIGLEAASIARKLGLEVTVIEAAPRILGRVASPATADHIRDLHQKHGAVIREGIGVEKILTDDGRVTGALMADGTTEEADFIIAGIGIIANDRLAAEAGLDCDQGIVVDACCRTSDPAIFAAGDCTRLDRKSVV